MFWRVFPNFPSDKFYSGSLAQVCPSLKSTFSVFFHNFPFSILGAGSPSMYVDWPNGQVVDTESESELLALFHCITL